MELRNRYEHMWDDLAGSTISYVQNHIKSSYFDHESFLRKTWEGVSIPIQNAFREKLDL